MAENQPQSNKPAVPVGQTAMPDPAGQTPPAQTTTQATPVTPGSVPAAKGKSSGLLAVLIAILVAAGLIALGFFAYNAKNEPKVEQDNQTQQAPVEESEIDQTTGEIDQTLQDMNNSSDFDDSQLTEEKLNQY